MARPAAAAESSACGRDNAVGLTSIFLNRQTLGSRGELCTEGRSLPSTIAGCGLKQRVEELERLQASAATAIQARSTALADAQRLVGKLEYLQRAAQQSLNDVRAHEVMTRGQGGIDAELATRSADCRRHMEVSVSQSTTQPSD